MICAAVAAAARTPFVFMGLMPDEGGYAYVASRWSSGAVLYDDAWADRPQGLLVAFRLLLTISEEPWAIRLGAVLCGAGITVLVGVIGWQLRNPATGVAAAAMYAVVGVGPRLNGFTFNGELAAALPASAAIAAALRWRSSARSRWLVVAGIGAGIAILMKQSGFDGLVVAIAIVALASVDWSTRWRALTALLAGAAVPLGISLVHGWMVGWERYWFAVVGYRFHSSSGQLDAAGMIRRAGHFFTSADDAWRDLGVVCLLAIAALVLARIHRASVTVPLIWLGAAGLGFNLGALYWRHYYVQLVPPLTLLAAIAVTSLPRLWRHLAGALAVLPVGIFLLALAVLPPERREELVPHWRPSQNNQLVAAQVRDRTDPDDAIYVLVSEPGLYFLADRPSAYRYLWGHPVEEIPGALEELRALLSSRERPAWLVVFTPPDEVDASGRLRRIIGRHYEHDPSIRTARGRICREQRDPGVSSGSAAFDACWTAGRPIGR